MQLCYQGKNLSRYFEKRVESWQERKTTRLSEIGLFLHIIQAKQSKNAFLLKPCFLSLPQGFPHISCVSLVISFFFLFKCASFSCPIVTFFFLFECHVKASIFSRFLMQMYCQITYFTSLYKLKFNLHVKKHNFVCYLMMQFIFFFNELYIKIKNKMLVSYKIKW